MTSSFVGGAKRCRSQHFHVQFHLKKIYCNRIKGKALTKALLIYYVIFLGVGWGKQKDNLHYT